MQFPLHMFYSFMVLTFAVSANLNMWKEVFGLRKAIQSLLKMHSPKMPYLYLKQMPLSVWN